MTQPQIATRRHVNEERKPQARFIQDSIRDSTFNRGKQVARVYVNPAEMTGPEGVELVALAAVKPGHVWVEEVPA